MKLTNLLLITLCVFAISCKPKVTPKTDINSALEFKIDSLNKELSIYKDSVYVLNNLINSEKDKYDFITEQLCKSDSTCQALTSELFVAKYKLGRIKEYSNIVARDDTQLKFLRGWINRVLEE